MFLILFVQYTAGFFFFKNRTIFDLEDKLLPVSNMASSGLKKMLVLTILYTHKLVSEKVVLYFVIGHHRLIIFHVKANVMPRQMLLPEDCGRC